MGSSTTSTTNITMTVAAAGLSIPLNQALTSRVLLMDTPGGSR
jgi:hypothetical protein